jgi:hypothetical protein
MIAGGPEPAHAGRLNMIRYVLLFYSGKTFLNIGYQYSLWNHNRRCEDEFWTCRVGALSQILRPHLRTVSTEVLQ